MTESGNRSKIWDMPASEVGANAEPETTPRGGAADAGAVDQQDVLLVDGEVADEAPQSSAVTRGVSDETRRSVTQALGGNDSASAPDATAAPNATAAPDATATPNARAEVYSDAFMDNLNQVLALRVLRGQDGTPNLADRNELRVALKEMGTVGNEGQTLDEILSAITKVKTPEEMREMQRNAKKDKEKITALDAASDYLDGDFAKVIRAKINLIGSEVFLSKEQEVDDADRELSDANVELAAAPADQKGAAQSKVETKRRNLSKLQKDHKKYEDQVVMRRELKGLLDVLFNHLSVLNDERLLPQSPQNLNELFERYSKQLRGYNPKEDKVDLGKVFDDIEGAIKVDKDVLIPDIDAKHAELSKSLRLSEQDLKIAQKGVTDNKDIPDNQFALKVFEYKIRKQNLGMEEDEVKKQAKKEFLNKLWEDRTGNVLDEAVSRVSGDVMSILQEADLKETVLGFKYKLNGSVVKPFEGIVEPEDLRIDNIDNFLKSRRLGLKSAFFLLSALEKKSVANTYQYGAIRKYVFELLVDEQGLTPAQAIRAFNDKNKKFSEVMDKYKELTDKTIEMNKEITRSKIKRAEAKVKSGESTQVDFLRELEDAGVAKYGKIDRAALSRLGVSTSYYLNHRYWDKSGSIAANRALWLGEQALVNPGLLAGRWLGAEALALAGGIGAFGKRLVWNYPLSVLRAPWHIVTHPFNTIFSPIKTMKGAGASVAEGFKKTKEGKVAGKEARRAFVKGQVDKGKARFTMEAKDRVDLTKRREDKNYDTGVKGLTAKIEKMEKEAEEKMLVLGSDLDMNFEKYKQITVTNEQETGQRQVG